MTNRGVILKCHFLLFTYTQFSLIRNSVSKWASRFLKIFSNLGSKFPIDFLFLREIQPQFLIISNMLFEFVLIISYFSSSVSSFFAKFKPEAGQFLKMFLKNREIRGLSFLLGFLIQLNWVYFRQSFKKCPNNYCKLPGILVLGRFTMPTWVQ